MYCFKKIVFGASLLATLAVLPVTFAQANSTTPVVPQQIGATQDDESIAWRRYWGDGYYNRRYGYGYGYGPRFYNGYYYNRPYWNYPNTGVYFYWR